MSVILTVKLLNSKMRVIMLATLRTGTETFQEESERASSAPDFIRMLSVYFIPWTLKQ